MIVVRPVWVVTVALRRRRRCRAATGRPLVSTVTLLFPLPSETVTEASPE